MGLYTTENEWSTVMLKGTVWNSDWAPYENKDCYKTEINTFVEL